MSFHFTAPGALWLLAAVPLVWLALRVARTNFNPRQRLLQTIVRSLLVATVVLAMARPVVSMGSSRLSIVYAVDISHSISSRAIDDAARRIDEIQTGLHPAHSRIVAFGENVAVVESTDALRALGQVSDVPATGATVDREGTNLERALREARAELAPGHVPRIVLFSDGWETEGDARDAVTRLTRDGVPVFVEPSAPRDLGDSWIDRVDVPAMLPPGTTTAVTVTIASQRAASGTIELREGTKVLASKPVAVASGASPIALDVSFDTPGSHLVEAVLTIAGDPLAANNRLRTEMLIGPRSRVLYVEGAPDSARYLRTALGQAGFDVTAGGVALLPSTAEQLEPWDTVILSDLSRASIPDASMTALAAWVEHDGGGLLVAGGESVFGEGAPNGPAGYRKTELERLTPVTFERKDEPEVALIIVLDKSWSMAGQQMELCKTAAQAAIDVLKDEQSVGVVTFNDELNWDVTLRNVGRNRDMIRKAVAAIEPSGHTLIYPAIEQAFNALKDARARAKHVVLLSDGRSYPDDYEGLVKKMVDAKITVSSIAVGAAADVELLTNIAKWGKGRSYVVEDAKEVPQIFVKEAKDAATPSFDEKAIVPVVKMRGFLDTVDVTKIPSLRGRTATVLKDGALQLMATKDGDPLLAFWPIGLGRTAVFASDVKDRWASDWVKWSGYGPFFSAVVHAVERQRAPALGLSLDAGSTHAGQRRVVATVEARDPRGNFLDLQKPIVRVTAGAASRDLTAHQVAPGRYEVSVTADATDAVTFTLPAAGTQAEVTRVLVPDTTEEYRFRPAREDLLRSIAAATGGSWHPATDALVNTAGASQVARRALWPSLVIGALVLWLVDIGVRRFRLFEAD